MNDAGDEDEAVRWAIRLDRSPLAAVEQDALDAWIGADIRRRGTLLRAQGVLAYLDRGRALAVPIQDRREPGTKPMSRRSVLLAGSMGSLAIAGTAAFLFAWPHRMEIRTGVGENRRVTLSDGSVVLVNTDSRIDVAMRDRSRNVQMIGEAWFHVAHDVHRPFTVEAGAVRVRAVGTAFSIRRQSHGVQVSVTEGGVDVWRDEQAGERRRIAAGTKAFVPNGGAFIEVVHAPEEIERALAWRTGTLSLDGESLSYAATEFNRYNARKLVIDDPGLGRERLVGLFRVDQPESFGRAVAKMTGAAVTVEDETIRLSRPSP